MSILVTGGAGYIGSHMTYALVEQGERVIVLDNLTSGDRRFVSADAEFVEGNAGDTGLVSQLIKHHKIQGVIHFAGSIVVPESVQQPLFYYANNVGTSRNLIDACVSGGVEHFLFSSTAAVYDDEFPQPVKENAPTNPKNPYGRTKLIVEWLLADTHLAHPEFRYMTLRYFNVAGADLAGRTGQPNRNGTHLITRACQAATGLVNHLDIYGNDYPTKDGTGIRDYIHVSDLVDAHLVALGALRRGAPPAVYNCGYGRGWSVLDIVKAMERVTGVPLPVRFAPRRLGDIPMLVADASRLRAEMNWEPKLEDLNTIIHSALDWERRAEKWQSSGEK